MKNNLRIYDNGGRTADRKTQKHTPGPWRSGPDPETVWANDAELIARTAPGEGHARAHANAARIVACVNACEGINPEAVPDLVRALEGLLADKYLSDPINADRMAPAINAIAKAKGGENG